MQEKREVAYVNGHPDLTVDVESGSIFCNNIAEHRAYEQRLEMKKNDASVRTEIETLKGEMEDIKSMLQVLINNKQ